MDQIKEYIFALIRSAMIAGGGAFVTSGLVTQDQLTTIISAVLVVAGVVWSLVAKNIAANKLKDAIATPAGKAS